MLLKDVIDMCRVKPGTKVRLKDHDPGWEGDKNLPREQRKQQAEKYLSQDLTALAEAQDLLYAADSWAVLVIFQALDAAGKDGTIKHVMSGLNPQGCQVFNFKQPSAEELDHTFLWRCVKALPERGRIGIFNRSYYEVVLVVKVHPEFLAAQKLPNGNPKKKRFWEDRYEDINTLERHLTRNGTVVIKFFLNVSKEEQRQRFLERINDPQKQWKFSAADLAERAHWNEYVRAYEQMLSRTSTEWAPWYVVPADRKWVTRAIVAAILTTAIAALDLRYPELTAEKLAQIDEARRRLAAEGET
jgi:PPK2 family polyphosphate:nucleotide phosphotransferase